LVFRLLLVNKRILNFTKLLFTPAIAFLYEYLQPGTNFIYGLLKINSIHDDTDQTATGFDKAHSSIMNYVAIFD